MGEDGRGRQMKEEEKRGRGWIVTKEKEGRRRERKGEKE